MSQNLNNNSETIISHKYEIRIRYADTDKMGFAYNGNYLRFFEIGRTELMRHFDLVYAELENNCIQLPLIQAHCNYHNAAVYDDKLQIQAELNLDTIGAKFRFNYTISRGDDLIATGFTEHLFMNADTKKATRPPKFFIEQINSLKKSLINNKIY